MESNWGCHAFLSIVYQVITRKGGRQYKKEKRELGNKCCTWGFSTYEEWPK